MSSSPPRRNYGYYGAALSNNDISLVHAIMIIGWHEWSYDGGMESAPSSSSRKTNFLSPVQFDNRTGGTALDALLLKLIPDISALHLQSLGLSESATKYSALLKKSMNHHVKAKAGITKQSYKHEEYNETFGGGQSKTTFLPNWLFQ
eukprot:12447470-Ditylum_brightwellii.AAC.1